MLKISRQSAWVILTTKKTKLLINANISIEKAKKITGVVHEEVEDILKEIDYIKILYFNDNVIVWDNGVSLEKDEISHSYVSDEYLFIDKGNWLMMFFVQ